MSGRLTSLLRSGFYNPSNVSKRRAPALLSRHLHSYQTPVDLEYDELIPQDGNKTDRPLIIIHGLFGSKRNWLSLTKAFHRDLNRPIYSLDLRNHGTSPHVAPMNYSSMANDVLHFCRKHELSEATLMGHSMGGKVAMVFALSPELPSNILSKLILVDIAPSKGDLSPEFKSYIEGMRKIEQSKISSRKEAQNILIEYEKDASVLAFLLTNFIPGEGGNSYGHFRVPLDLLGDSISELGNFPYEPGERTWDGRTLFIKGTKSKFINRHNTPLCKEYFPNMTLESLETGHWVHAEKPNEFKKLVSEFIGRDPR